MRFILEKPLAGPLGGPAFRGSAAKPRFFSVSVYVHTLCNSPLPFVGPPVGILNRKDSSSLAEGIKKEHRTLTRTILFLL